ACCITITFFGLRMITVENNHIPSSASLTSSLLRIPSRHAIASLFPKTAQEIQDRVEHSLNQVTRAVAQLVAIPNHQRTWDNTVRAYDYIHALSDAAIMGHILTDLELVSPEEEIRKAAHAGALKIQETFIDL